ncbi:MAG: tRNA (adenosine(37)-N6)-dimethylallyltransferase MiaA [Bilifractor sp.]|jgi:tRNA dimethylallyltransferase
MSGKMPCMVIAGPTAVGKSKLSIRVAREIGGSVISADSMQIYRRMNIGTAKITREEMGGIPHYLIDELEPSEPFNVFLFQKMARSAMREICAAGRIPIIAGGTGFYIQAFLKDVDFTETEGESAYRRELEKISREGGSGRLYDRLKEIDPRSASIIHPHNIKRIIRALEYYHETGRPISEHNDEQRRKESPYRYVYFVLTDRRENIYRRINQRVDRMVQEGLFEEAEQLIREGLPEDCTSMKGLGYREMFPYFRGEISKEETIRQIKLDTRHFAKRQLTWFRREPGAVWIDQSQFGYDEDRILKEVLSVWKIRMEE